MGSMSRSYERNLYTHGWSAFDLKVNIDCVNLDRRVLDSVDEALGRDHIAQADSTRLAGPPSDHSARRQLSRVVSGRVIRHHDPRKNNDLCI